MIALCREADLPEPEFRQDGGQFVMTLWRDWLTDSILSSLNLSERQRQAIAFARLEGRITNAGHQKLTGGSRRTALRELDALVQFGILDPKGKGHGAPLCLGKNETRHKCANSQTEHKAAKGNMNCIVPNLQTSPDFSRPNPS